jgi:hypothetical protein
MRSFYRVVAASATVLTLILPSASNSQFSVWKKVFNGQGLCIGVNPINPSTLYAQGNDARIWVSRNRGTTWSQLAPVLPFQLREILVHPKDTMVIFATDFSNGLRRSTNGGASWTTVIASYGIDGESVGLDPVHPDTMYAGNFSDAAVYRSTDRGATWTLKGHAGGTGLCGLAVRPDSSDILYAGAGNGQISKSTNAGQSWHLVKPGGSSEIPKIVINPANPQIAYASAFAGNVSATGVWKTTDGGESWTLLAGLGTKSMWSLEINPQNPSTVWSGTFDEPTGAAIWRTNDAGVTWTKLNKGLAINDAGWNLKIDPLDTTNLYAGATVGDFGANGVFKLSNASAGIEGFVRDSLTNSPIASGSMVINPEGSNYDLNLAGGAYGFYRFDGDTNTQVTASVTINSQLFKVQQIALINDSIMAKDIIVQPGKIQGTLFNDLNGNGFQDGGETGLNNWTILVTGQVTATVHSDASGHYAVDDLFPGTYTVAVQTKLGWVQTSPLSPSTYTLGVSMASKFYSGEDFGNRIAHHITSAVPPPNANNVAGSTTIHAVFDTAMDVSTFHDTSTWIVSGSSSGLHRGAFSFGAGDTSVTFTPADSFQAGETVTLVASGHLSGVGGSPFTPYVGQFTIAVPPSPATFLPRVDYNVGSGPWAVAVADMNGDGKNDIVAASPGPSTVSVLLNTGNGLFGAPAPYSTGLNPRSIAIGDIDNDGDIDVVTANNGFTNITVLKNNGSGILGGRVDYSAGGNPSAVALADIDGDGYLDIVISNTAANQVAFLINDGTGGFSAPHTYSAGASPWWSAVADMNADGGFDIVAGNSLSSSTVSILTNIGSGRVSLTSSSQAGGFVRFVAAADFTNDRRMDFLGVNSSSNSITVYRQDTSGNFPTRTDVTTGNGPWGAATGDVDGDGFIDVIVANASGNSVSVLKNNGGTGFTRTDYTAGSIPRGVAAGDLDGDGDLDLVVANSGDGTVSVLLNSLIISGVNGWNLVSVPTSSITLTKSALFPHAISRAFAYEGGYVTIDTLKNGVGYWVKMDTARPIGYNGTKVLADTLNLTAGWNLIGTIYTSVNPASVITNPPDILSSPYFGYNGAYNVASTLDPGYGYWVKLKSSGALSMSSAPQQQPKVAGKNDLDAFSSLTFEDAKSRRQTLYFSSVPEARTVVSRYEVPPLPPEGSFDARFTTQRLAEAAVPGERQSLRIDVTGAAYPVKVAWKLREGEPSAWTMVSAGASTILGNQGKSVLAEPQGGTGTSILLNAIASGTNLVPREFSLDQNYPNPFNPSTEIRYQIASSGRALLTIHDVLGREVARLVDEDRGAGYYSAQWNASGVSTGVYYARLTVTSAGGSRLFESERKLVLMR